MKLPIIPPNPRDVGGTLYRNFPDRSTNVATRDANKTYNIASNVGVSHA